jgi:SAM-dependent methyltransferase
MTNTESRAEARKRPPSRLRSWVRSRLDPEAIPFTVLQLGYSILTFDAPRRSAAMRRLRRGIAKDGIFANDDELYMCSLFPRALLDVVLEELRPRTALDVGCGTGQSLGYLVDRGVDATGVEGSPLAVQHAKNPERIVQADLRRPLDLGRRFDLVWSYEVAEHIHPSFTDTFVASLTRHADRIVMSAARPGQGGEGHFNEQPPEYWIAKLDASGYELDARLTERLRGTPDEFAANMMVFVRRR